MIQKIREWLANPVETNRLYALLAVVGSFILGAVVF